jgi:hypothetical protein
MFENAEARLLTSEDDKTEEDDERLITGGSAGPKLLDD